MAAPMYINPPTPPAVERGIFDVSLMGDLVDGAALYGLIYQPDSCSGDFELVAVDCPAPSGTKALTAIEAPISGAPFAVTATYTCSPVGVDLTEAERRVRLRMQLNEQRAVERAIWSGSAGALGTIPSKFADAEILGPASCPVEAIELLEQWLADNAIHGGLIHARPGMSPHLANNFLFKEPTLGNLQTHLGTRLVFGFGYAGTGPSGQAVTADTEWMYATGRILLWRTPVFVGPPRETFDRRHNLVDIVAEREYLAIVECGVAAVQVTRSCLTAGSA